MEKYVELNKTGRITKTDVLFNQAETAEHMGDLLNTQSAMNSIL